ncbi:hypothetical protein GCM10009841_27390 [Microlunatus panaciterrae]
MLAALAVLAGCSTQGADEQTRSGSEDGYVGARSLTRVAPADRKQAPIVSGASLGAGKEISTESFKGKIIVLNVWGSWCSPCRHEATALQQASVKTADIAQFIGINTRDTSQSQGLAFTRAFKIGYPSIYDPKGQELLKFAGDLPPAAIPSTLIIDSDGKVAVRILGPISSITLVDLINDVNEGK